MGWVLLGKIVRGRGLGGLDKIVTIITVLGLGRLYQLFRVQNLGEGWEKNLEMMLSEAKNLRRRSGG